MIGYDFSLFWNIGQAVLNGANPYSIAISWYPPITSLVFAVFGLLPFIPAYAIWTGINIVLGLASFRRLAFKSLPWAWLFYAPAVFILLSGQVDIIFLWLAGLLPKGGWKAVVAAVAITMKPQIALIILPWYLVRWLKADRKLILWWLLATLILQLLPILFRPTIFQDWVASLQGAYGWKMILSSGVFSLTSIGLPFWLVTAIALPIAIWGLFQDETTSRAAQLLACPVTFWYEDIFLAGSVPAILLIPFSLLAFLAAYLLQNNLPLVSILFVVLAYRLVTQRQKRVALAGR
jgi:hypothetical protein